jgi:hypothetical protein
MAPDISSTGKPKNFAGALLAEWSSAIISSATVAPAISIIDKAIIANAAGRQPLLEGISDGFKTFFTKPHYFVRQPAFLWIWGVYAGTYITANTIQVTCDYGQVNSFVPKFLGSSVANVSLSVAKDRAFTRMFGKGLPKPLPLPSYALFTARDSLTILAGFSLPPIIAERMNVEMGIARPTADLVAQLTIPCAVQFISSPMHLLGLDLYNRSQVSGSDRVSFIRREYLGTSLARIGRIFPAYGVGGVINRKLRNTFRAWADE